MKQLIEDAYDLHIHSSPDILPRKVNDIEMAKRISTAGMGGYCMKSHYFCTAERAELMNKTNPQCHSIGSITLNSSVGGLNPAAVEIGARAGIKIVWMPTCDSEYEQRHIFESNAKNQTKLPFWANVILELKRDNVSNPTISLLEGSKLKPVVYEILDIISKHDITLATGHISHQETFALVKAAKERKVNKIIITHVDFPSTFYTIEEQKELAGYGAYMEHCYTTYATGKVDFSTTVEQIKKIGVDRVIISSDLGQVSGVYPDEGMLDFSTKLYERGFFAAEIKKMNCDNPKYLIS